MTQVKRPVRLDIVDMPRDTTRALGGLRQAICASFNYCRKYPAKMVVLKQVLKYTYSRIVEWEKQHEAEQVAVEKVKLEQEARKLGVELDSRNTVEKMRAALDEAKEQANTEAEQLAKDAAKPAKSGDKAAESTKTKAK